MSFKQNIKEIQSKHTIFKYISLFGIIGIGVGILGGYLYFRFIGCQSGSCPITSNPWASIAWGAVLGYLIGDSIFPVNRKKSRTEDDKNKKEEQ